MKKGYEYKFVQVTQETAAQRPMYFGNATADSEYDFQVTQNMDVLVTMLRNSLYYIHIIYSESQLVLHCTKYICNS